MKIKVITIFKQRQAGKTTDAVKYIEGKTLWLAETAFAVRSVKDKYPELSNDFILVLSGGIPKNVEKLSMDIRKTIDTIIVDDYDHQPSLMINIPYIHAVHFLFPNVKKVVFTKTTMVNKVEEYEEETDNIYQGVHV